MHKNLLIDIKNSILKIIYKIPGFLKKHIPKIIFLTLTVIFIIILYTTGLNRYFNIMQVTNEKLISLKNIILTFSFFGPLVILILYFVFGIFCMPTFYFIFICGFLYGPIYGLFLGWVGMIVGFMASFINIRYMFKNDFANKFGTNTMVIKLENYVKKYNFFAVFILRIFFFIPYNIQNIAYGLSSISIFKYLLGSALGVIPITILYAYLGSAFSKNQITPDDLKNIMLYIGIFIGFIASVFFTCLIVIYIKKKISLDRKNS
jgi:uncharacterized membrane protein YdjX (TVP38/TMEM64 family)